MSRELTFRIANPGDSAGIAELLGQLGYPSPVSDVEDRLARLTALESERVITAERDGEVLGVVCVHLTPRLHAPGNLGRITALVVANEERGKGIGRRLVREAESWAWSHECSGMELTSGDHRPDAHRFYEACGYGCEAKRFVKQRPSEANQGMGRCAGADLSASQEMNAARMTLIAAARAVVGDLKLGDEFSAGGVGAAVRTVHGNIYTGICIDLGCGLGFCAEVSAIAQMLTHRETRIDAVVAVTSERILPPCGRCRETMIQIDPRNRDCRVVIAEDREAPLIELLPNHWLSRQEDAEQRIQRDGEAHAR